MNEIIIGAISTLVCTSIGSVVTFFLAKAKYKTEVESNKIDNFSRSIEAYKGMYEDMIGDLKNQNAELKEEVNSLKQELNKTREQVLTLTNIFLVGAMKGQKETIDPQSVNQLLDLIKNGTEQK